jgi:hypothetical protein
LSRDRTVKGSAPTHTEGRAARTCDFRTIDQLHQSLALADTDTFLYGPAQQHTPDHEHDTDHRIRRHTAAQQAIHDARTADEQLHTAAKPFHAVATELVCARAALETAPSYRRSQRRTLQARIDALVGE